MNRMSRIHCKFADFVLVPRDAYDVKDIENLETLDGYPCAGKLITTWDNTNDYWDKELREFCMDHWGIGFEKIKHIYRMRIGDISNVWDYIKLTKIDI